MRYPNLLWAISQHGLAHWQAARKVDMHESSFSRSLSGRREFTTEEREGFANFLGYPAEWLFAEVTPPSRVPRLEDRERMRAAV